MPHRHPFILRRLAVVVALLASAAGAQAKGVVEVNFIELDKFTDIGLSAYDRERASREIGAYLKGLGRQLPDGQTVTIDVLDVDLAGTPAPGKTESRSMRGTLDYPKVHLRWTLAQNGKTLQSGEDQVEDSKYAETKVRRRPGEAYPIEQHMLGRWFNLRFGGAKAAHAQ